MSGIPPIETRQFIWFVVCMYFI